MELVSVTTVLQPFANFDNIRPDILERAATRGIACHAAYASYAAGFVPELDPEWEGRWQSWLAWYDEAVLETIAVEVELVCHLHGYIGHADWIGKLKGQPGVVALADWKGGAVASKTWRLQVAGYYHAAQEIYGVNRVLIVQPHPKGGRAKVTEHTKTLSQDFDRFRMALALWRFFNE